MDGTDPASALTFSEITDLNKRKLELKATNTAYLSSHPEVRSMLNDFMSSCLLDKPDDVYGFAKEFFAEMRPEHSLAQGVGGWQPVVICGPSGVGKQTLINLLVVQYSQKFGFTIQHTTRPPRPGEDSSDYHFITLDEMQQGIEDGKFLEYSNVHGNLYGTSFESVQEVRASGKICLLSVDKEGCEKLRNTALRPKFLFIAPPDLDVLEDRLRDRATDTEEEIQRALSKAKDEVSYGEAEGNFDKVIVNEVLEDAFDTVKKLFEAWYPHLLHEEEEEGEERGDKDDGEKEGIGDRNGEGKEGEEKEVGEGKDDK